MFPHAQDGGTQRNPHDHSPQGNPYDHSPFSSKSLFSAATPVTTYTSAIDAYDTWMNQQRVHTAGERAGSKWSPMLPAGVRPHTVSNHHRSWEAVHNGPTDSPSTSTRRPAYCEGNYWHWGTSEQAHRLRHTRIHDLPVMSRWRLPSAREGPGCPAVTCWGPPVRHPWREKRYYKQGRVGEQQLFRTVANALVTG
jgi:hypothetical protein